MTEQLSIRIKIAPVNMARAQRWGDYFFACSLRDALLAQGHDVEIQARDTWYADTSPGGIDLVLRGFGGYEPIPNRVSMMWIISHPGNLQSEELQLYDHIFTASLRHHRPLRKIVGGGKVTQLLQACDPKIMRPDIENPVKSQMLFVGVNRRGGRPALSMAHRCGYSVDLYGTGWQDHEDFGVHFKDHLIPNTELGRHYAGASVVLNDHWRDMRVAGYPSNRVFDVLACGTPLISDMLKSMPTELREWIYMFNDEDSFRAAAEAALAETDERRAQRKAFARIVQKEHGFPARAKVISERGSSLREQL